MWMILKNFKLSKNPLVHLFYLFLIVTTVSNRTVKNPADPTIQNDENINDVIEDTDPIRSNVAKESTINDDGVETKKNTIQEIYKRMSLMKSKTPKNENEINIIDPEENNISVLKDEIEDQTLDVEDDAFSTMTLGLSSESTTPKILEPEEKKKEKKRKKKKNKKQKKKKNSGSIPEQSINENDLQTEAENMVGTSDTAESNIAQIISDSEKTSIENTQGTFESTTLGDPGPKEIEIDSENDQVIEEENIPEQDGNGNDLQTKAENMVETNAMTLTTPEELDSEEKKIEAENVQSIEDETTSSKKKETSETISDTLYPFEPIDPQNLKLSSLENVEIVKIKNNPNATSEIIRKEKKKSIFKEFKPTEGNARIYCTFLGNVLKMYNKVKKRFVGHFCHAIVFGTPIFLQQHRVHLSENMREQLHSMHSQKQQSLLIVIMQYRDYNHWVQALHNTNNINNLIIDIIHTVVRYKIDGIQFSNLHPIKEEDGLNTKMMNNLKYFFKQLQHAAKKKNHELKIGITIEVHDLSMIQSFTSFNNINSLVTWYSLKTISMVTCSSEYKNIGTSPLEGDKGLKTIINTFIEQINHNNNFDITKIVVGVQLFPNKVNELHPYTYEELCSTQKSTWNSWCIMQPEDLRLKGKFLRGTQIGGVQLYYMHSDDYRSTCGCYSFPLIRALLRGLIKFEMPEDCNFITAHN